MKAFEYGDLKELNKDLKAKDKGTSNSIHCMLVTETTKLNGYEHIT